MRDQDDGWDHDRQSLIDTLRVKAVKVDNREPIGYTTHMNEELRDIDKSDACQLVRLTLQETINEIFAKHDAEVVRLTKQRDEATKERDSARRMVCDLKVADECDLKVADEWGFSPRYLAKEFAEEQGWDCFKEEETQ